MVSAGPRRRHYIDTLLRVGSTWPSLKARAMLRLLESQLGYEVIRQEGSHCVLRAKGRPQLVFAFHDRVTVPPRVVRAILVQQVGLTLAEAEEVVKHA